MKKIVSSVLVVGVLMSQGVFANEYDAQVSQVMSRVDNVVQKGNISYNDMYERVISAIPKAGDRSELLIELAEAISLKMDRETTFVPYGGYHSTVEDTVFVEASNMTALSPGEKIKDLTAKSFTFAPTTQRMTEKTYWVQVGFYNAMFYVGEQEVLVVDTLAWGFGQSVIAEIRKVTDKPITTLVYSHQHEDHIGDVQFFIDEAKKDGYDLEIITTDRTSEVMQEHSSLPPADTILDYTGDSFSFEDEMIRVQGFTNPAHEADSAMWIFENEKVMHIPDYVNPNQMAYLSFGQSQTYRSYRENLEEMFAQDFEFFSGGHGNVGGRADVAFMLEYTADLEAAIAKASSAINTFDYFTSDYNNHQASALRGENEIVAFVMNELRPKYGNFYGFEASVPHQIRFVMLTNH